MGDSRGQVHAITVLAPVTNGREEELRQLLDGFPAGERSPLARVAGTHFARWVLMPELVYGARPQKPDVLRSQYLLFASTFDGPADAYLEALRTTMAEEADAVWGHCDGYPGAGERGRFRDWMRRWRVPTGLFVAAYPEATVEDVRRALALRERVSAFALATQGAPDGELRESFRATFGC